VYSSTGVRERTAIEKSQYEQRRAQKGTWTYKWLVRILEYIDRWATDPCFAGLTTTEDYLPGAVGGQASGCGLTTIPAEILKKQKETGNDPGLS
jgi:hypothetical protein